MYSTRSLIVRSKLRIGLMPSTAVLAWLGLQLTAVQSGAQNNFSAQAGAISSGYSARFDLASESILNVHGDSWTTAWCDNDQQYVFSDDSTNIDGRCVNATNSKGYNITYGQLTTSSPYSSLAGFA